MSSVGGTHQRACCQWAKYPPSSQPKTSFHLSAARDYDPEIGRWTSRDPIGFGGKDTNVFSYSLNAPVNLFDPLGLIRFNFGDHEIVVQGSLTFLPLNVTWDFEGFGSDNFNVSAVFPPISLGFGIGIQIDPPKNCDFSVFIGAGKNLSVGTNFSWNPETQEYEPRGFNLDIGLSVGPPIGATFPKNDPEAKLN